MQRNPKDYTLAVIALVVLIAVLASSCTRTEYKRTQLQSNVLHSCKWATCPYHMIKPSDYRKIVEYVGNEGTDAYYIDSLHLAYPTYEYEQLDSMLFTLPYNK